jgi:hypothetical protein
MEHGLEEEEHEEERVQEWIRTYANVQALEIGFVMALWVF